MQPAENQNEQEQGQGRIIRIGQARTPIVLTLALGDSYDEQLMSRAERKMMPMIAASQLEVTMTPKECEDMLRGHGECVVAGGVPEMQARQLRNERIYQVLTGVNCTFGPRRRIEDCTKLQFNTCGHVARTPTAPGLTPKKPEPRQTLKEYTDKKRQQAAAKAASKSEAAKTASNRRKGKKSHLSSETVESEDEGELSDTLADMELQALRDEIEDLGKETGPQKRSHEDSSGDQESPLAKKAKTAGKGANKAKDLPQPESRARLLRPRK
jgi:hypothetical protein